MISREEIECELGFYERLKEEMRSELRHLPKGTIYFKSEHGHKRPYVREQGKLKYLSQRKRKLIEGLSNRAEIERSLMLLEKNEKSLKQMYQSFVDLHELIPANLAISPGGLSRTEITKAIDQWAEERAWIKDGNPRTQHITSDGNCVRSKSELLLYECFKSHGLAFQYEKPTIINGSKWYTDFSLLRGFDGYEIKWEHFGMMLDTEYRINAQNKIYAYASNGYWPFDNFVATYDFGDGKIDMRQIEEILKMMKLIQ